MEELKANVKYKIKDVRRKYPPFIKVNLYAVTDAMLVFALLLFLLAIFEKDKMVKLMMVGFSCIPASIACFSTGAQIFHGKTTVKNHSGRSICAKPEEGCDTFNVQAGKNIYDIDGVKSNGIVYKIGDSCHAIVRKDGTVKIQSFTGRFINKFVGGGILTAPPDEDKECWQKLFDC